ncbi:hypothetical protein DID76_04105 [Candidatus Marinamargulisbacteria bacterium SCGC AG-414-C22]|nr:hypothetical protein DID76_04105 [Candidatus Marinamargulisbacteria bacterium SCGC AG-414-C22]
MKSIITKQKLILCSILVGLSLTIFHIHIDIHTEAHSDVHTEAHETCFMCSQQLTITSATYAVHTQFFYDQKSFLGINQNNNYLNVFIINSQSRSPPYFS